MRILVFVIALVLCGVFTNGYVRAQLPVPAAPTAAPITIDNAYAYATAPTQISGAVFFILRNTAAADDRLTGAASDIANAAEIHTTMDEEDQQVMVRESGVDIAGGAAVAFDPNGHHIMLTGLYAPLKEGSSFTLTLKFLKAGDIQTNVIVRAPQEP